MSSPAVTSEGPDAVVNLFRAVRRMIARAPDGFVYVLDLANAEGGSGYVSKRTAALLDADEYRFVFDEGTTARLDHWLAENGGG